MVEDKSGEGGGPALEVKQPGLKFLEAAVYIMGGLLVLMVIGLIGGIIWKATRKAPVEPIVPAIVDIETMPGARIGQMSVNGDRAILQITRNGEDEVVVVDVKKGAILTRIRLQPAGPAP
jgi:hypothetical protein